MGSKWEGTRTSQWAKHLFFTAEGAALVAFDGTLVTTIPASWYDAGYLELVRIFFGG